MADVKQVRHKLTVALVVMLCLDALCAVVLFSPIGRGAREGRQKEAQLWAELKSKTRETEPLHGLDSKIVEAKSQIKDFYAQRFPENFASVPETLNKLAAANGVTLSAAKYSSDETDIPGLHAVRVDAAIDGDYIKEAKFINAVERDKMFFIIDSVALGEQQKGGVHLQIKFETYVRSQAAL
jgi:type IV pilus assembly protein PilO